MLSDNFVRRSFVLDICIKKRSFQGVAHQFQSFIRTSFNTEFNRTEFLGVLDRKTNGDLIQ